MRSKDNLLRLHRFKLEERRRQVAEIEQMIAEFLRKQDELEAHIRMEENRNGVSDPAHFNYSTSAKASRLRRDNLLRSIGELKDQLDSAKTLLAEEESELRKIELLAEKEGEARAEVPAVPTPQSVSYIR
ncbi:MAG TPA: flagellar export protein FliJ [Aestuariivirgaceae bacterium]|jgi:flagellar export protein FliJ